jgi:hypothetical protein
MGDGPPDRGGLPLSGQDHFPLHPGPDGLQLVAAHPRRSDLARLARSPCPNPGADPIRLDRVPEFDMLFPWAISSGG